MTRLEIEQIYHDSTMKNIQVEDISSLDRILNKIEVVSLRDLPEDYKKRTKISNGKYFSRTSKDFYALDKKDIYRRVVGRIRVRDLMPIDNEVLSKTYFSIDKIYWGIRKEILYKLIELRNILKAEGLNPNGFEINHGYRYPKFNEQVGGAPLSRHISGDAVDINVLDINNDNLVDESDKKLLLEICENKLIGNKGGVGRYPNTQIVHIDLRGRRARWDSY